MDTFTITMPGEAISLKNSKQVTKARRVIPSRAYKSWHERVMDELDYLRPLGIGDEWEYPVIVLFFFYRKTKRKFDLHNMVQGPMDILVELDVIKDDDMKHAIVAFDGVGWAVDKENPRVEIKIYKRGLRPNAKTQKKQNQIQAREKPVIILRDEDTVGEDYVPEWGYVI